MIKVKKLYSINKKFKRYHGWSGADGIFTYKYNQKIIMYFSDTFVGESNTKGQRVSFQLINNSLAISDKKLTKIDFIYPTNPIKSVFETKDGYYWLEDGIIENDCLFIFALKMNNDIFSNKIFEIKNVDLIKLNLSSINEMKYETYPFYPYIDNIVLGTSIIKENDYYYIFGYVNKYNNKKLILARKKSLLDSKIEFLSSDHSFKENYDDLLILKENFASEFKFIKIKDKYYCAYTKGSIGKEIYLLIVEDLFKKYEKEVLIYTCKEHKKDIITYNSKIQQALSNNRNLIISYNVNTLINDNHINLDIYRPRFIKISLKEIENEI